jgi:3-hydroxyacyl-[acyl-carrier-protein] dehydratase
VNVNRATGEGEHRAIVELLPHRPPFLLIDRVLELVDGERIVALRNVTIGEPYFQGHFPGYPVVPGVLVCEALAQAGSLLAHRTRNGVAAGSTLFLAALDHVRFRRPVVPGDQMRLEVAVIRRRAGVWRFRGVVSVDGEVAAEGEVTAVERSVRR